MKFLFSLYLVDLFYLFFAATNAARAIELTFVSKESALEVNITGADVPTRSPPFFDFEKYVNVLYITFAVSMFDNNNTSALPATGPVTPL